MLENIREGVQKPWLKIVIFIVIIAFVFSGGFVGLQLFNSDAVIKVNDQEITRVQLKQAYEYRKSTNLEYYNATVKTDDDKRRFQEGILQNLIQRQVILQSLDDLELNLSKAALTKAIQSDTNNQVDGKYSSELVKNRIKGSGMSTQAFKQDYKNQAVYQQLSSGLQQSEFSLSNEIQNDYALTAEKRSGRAITIKFDNFQQKTSISNQELKEYYQQNQEKYRADEQVSIEYLELSVNQLMAQQKPSEQQIQQYYDENSNDARFRVEEERQYSHILINGNDDQALAKANSIRQRLEQGEDFASIAKTESDDIPTRETGGDLGVMPAGSLDPESETVAKLLTNINDVSQPIKLSSGYQILKLTDIKPGKLMPLEKVKQDIIDELARSAAEADFYDKSIMLKDQTFQYSDSLAQAAQETGLEIKTSPLFSRNSASGLFANQKVKETAFSDTVLSGSNSKLIEIADNHHLVMRIKEHKPSSIKPLDTVKQQVEKTLTQIKAKQAAEELANTLLAKLKAAEENEVNDLMKKHNLEWIDLQQVERNNASLSYQSNAKFFKMPAPQKAQATFDIAEDFQTYTLLSLNSVEKGIWSEADDAKKKQRQLYISNFFSNAIFQSYIKDLRNQAEVKRYSEDLVN